MAKLAPSFEDRISLIAAELTELGKRPVSSETYDELVDIQERLGGIVGEFIMCESCGGMFPSVIQLTIGGVAATLCKSCAITAIQKDSLELAADSGTQRQTPRKQRTSQKKQASKVQSTAEPPSADDGAGEEDISTDSDENKQAPAQPRTGSTTRTRRTAPRSSSPARTGRKRDTEDGDDGDDAQSTHFGVRTARTRKPVSGPFIIEESDSDTSVDDILSAPRARAARPPKTEEPVLKASYAAVAKHLERTTREVRQIGKLVEEISPPMDVEKTTRYVLAELRNQRSKIPQEVVPLIVSTLKNGLPSKDNGDAET